MNFPGRSLLRRAAARLGRFFQEPDPPAGSPFKAQAGSFARSEAVPPGSPLVSVVVPCYNHGRVVGEAVNSILTQTWQDAEILIVDDGSDQPETVRRLDRLQHPRTVVIRHERNRGLPAARNTGLRQARGRYVCCLDADDKLHPTYLEKALSLMESNLGIGFVYAWTQVFGEESRTWYTPQFDPEGLLDHNQLNPPAVFRRAAWEEVGGFREAMRDGYEDWEFWIRLAYHGYRGFRMPEKLIFVRREGESFIHRAAARQQELVQQIKDLNPGIYQDRSWLQDVLQGYDDVYVDRPFLNLRASDAFRPLENPRLFVYQGGVGSSSADFQRLARKLTGHEGQAVVVALVPLEEEAADELFRLTDHVYILPHFLPEYAWDGFVEGVLKGARGLGEVQV